MRTFKYITLGAALLILIWLALHVNYPLLIPNPLVVTGVFISLFMKGVLPLHLLHSLVRILGGVLLAVSIGYPLGLMAGLSDIADKLLSSIAYYMHPLPKIAFLPIFMVLFGLGNTSKIALIFSILVLQIFIFTRDGVKDIDSEYFKVAKLLKLSPFDRFKNLIMPSTLPRLFSALRISIGISISVLFFAENYATTYGIGYFIMNSWSMVNYEQMFAGIISIAILGMTLYSLLDWIERKVCPWIYL